MLSLIRGLFIFVVLLVLALLGAYVYLRMSLPKVNGSLTIPGLGESVEIVRDQYAVPHIYAKSE